MGVSPKMALFSYKKKKKESDVPIAAAILVHVDTESEIGSARPTVRQSTRNIHIEGPHRPADDQQQQSQ